MQKAVANVNEVLGPALLGMDPVDQEGLDNKVGVCMCVDACIDLLIYECIHVCVC